ncbi:hypothetical protein Aph01nite_19290 [Acrocarpospora phusangensis]|uniref:Uncharacterized protein n=1 Tax=Acrocarpospora phusangensis TaxID=1070424 RepID=A0A919Q9E5_9ACTN|nr:hypothetical protein [Acrocarpospora phusangensis]GIH23619.1 hypothetical protein Aph01nite_19290 [Acrocarpospora phusangensis]
MNPTSRYAGGVSLVPVEDGWLVHTPGEDFLVVSAPEGDRPDRPPLDDPGLMEAFAEEGVLEPVPVRRQGTVALTGEGPLFEAVGLLLGQTGLIIDDEDAAVRIAVSPWLRDGWFRRLDAEARDAGTALHLGFAEGRRWYAGPFWTGPATASYEDLRVRRLAASPWPEELAAYWAWLDSGGAPETGPEHGVGAHVAAALIVSDVRAYLHGGQAPGTGVQAGFDPGTGLLRRHLVLPVPGGLMVEQP